jgi:plastocyanin
MRPWLWLAGLLAVSSPAAGQSVLERSPNLQGVWGLSPGHPVFVLSHRFEFLAGGDELFSVPTLTLAIGLPFGLTTGVDFTSFSEAIPDRVLGNEAQYWLKRPVSAGPATFAGIAAYNGAARSLDAALGVAAPLAALRLFGEARAFTDLFGQGVGGLAGALGAGLMLTDYLGVTGDIGRVLSADTIPSAWSAALAVGIPASPHTFALQISNTGATTLQGASRAKTIGTSGVRYGFTFTIPFGNRERWRRIIRPPPPARPNSSAERQIDVKDLQFLPAEVRIRPGERVEWVNRDPVAHTVSAEDGSWGSNLLAPGESYVRLFTVAGRYPYYCAPHPEMRAVVVVVEER